MSAPVPPGPGAAGDERVVRLLEEIRDLQLAQDARHRRALEVQERSVAMQEASIAAQREAIETQRRIVRRLLPLVVVALLAILVPYLLRVVLALAWR